MTPAARSCGLPSIILPSAECRSFAVKIEFRPRGAPTPPHGLNPGGKRPRLVIEWVFVGSPILGADRMTVAIFTVAIYTGGISEARARLSATLLICAWFTEGLDTPALKEAKALLTEL